jgi:hypothetical protein
MDESKAREILNKGERSMKKHVLTIDEVEKKRKARQARRRLRKWCAKH